MPLLLGLMLQAISSAPPERVDLTVTPPCAPWSSTDAEIVVCADRRGGPSPYRIEPAPPADSAVPKAEVKLANGVSAAAETETHDVGGFPSKRAMIRLRFKF